MCRVAINHDLLTEPLVALSGLLAVEGVPLHLAHFAKLWIDVYQTKVGGAPRASSPASGLQTGWRGGWGSITDSITSNAKIQ